MFSNSLLNIIIITFITTGVLIAQHKELSYFEQLNNAFVAGYMDRVFDHLDSIDEIFSSDESTDNKYNYLHQHKFSSPQSLEECIKFHDSEIVSLNLSRMNGRWDRHLISIPFPEEYHFAQAEYQDEKEVLNFKYEPWGYKSLMYARNDTNMIKTVFVFSELMDAKITLDEAFIATDYKSYFLKYSCVRIGHLARVSGSLHFQLRPEMTNELNSNLNLFAEILDSIPEKSLNKINHLIPKLIHEMNEQFEEFGIKYDKILTQRLKKYRTKNLLSDESDDKVFQFLNEKCLNFTDEELNSHTRTELVLGDMSKITSNNWKLEETDLNNERIGFNRMTIKIRSDNSYAVSLFDQDKHIADSDHYFDSTRLGFWTFTEGRRSLEIPLHCSEEHRLIYCCEEILIEGKLQIKQKLRYFLAQNNSTSTSPKGETSEQVLNQLSPKLNSNNLQEIRALFKNMSPLKSSDKSFKHDDL